MSQPEQPIPLFVAGADGRMGSLACELLGEGGGFRLAGRLVRGDDSSAAFDAQRGAVLLDLSLHPASVEIVSAAVAAGVHPVVGVSGWTDAQLDALEASCAAGSLGALWVPNFSLGAVLQMRFAEEAARWFARARIHETHPPTKRDRPSGTALATARRMAAARSAARRAQTGDAAAAAHEAPPEPPIRSTRRAGAVAEQTVALEGTHEELTLQHRVDDRRAFADGMRLACARVRELDGLVRGLQALLVDGPARLL